MSTLYLLGDSDKLANVSAPTQAEAYKVWINQQKALEERTFGQNQPRGVLPHDHSERRGYPLLEAFWSCSFGPQGAEGGAANAWTMGLPLLPPATSYDFAASPKCLGWWPFRVPAQVKAFYLEFLIYMDGAITRSVALKARVRPYAELGLNHDKGLGPSASIITQQTSGGARVTRDQFVFSDIKALGDVGLDKEELVLELWLMSNTPAASLYRLVAASAVAATSYGVGIGEPIENTPARAEVQPQEIRTSELVLSDTAQRAHLRYNQATVESLGRAPGLESDLQTENEDDPFLTVIYGPHQHHGRRWLDPVSGLATYDGAVTKRLLWLSAPLVNMGDSAADMTNQPGQGLKLHSGGTLATQAELRGRVHLPIGQQALFLRFAVKPGHAADLCRLYLYVALQDVDGNNIDLSVNSSGVSPQSVKASSFTVVDVNPLDNFLWQRNSTRLQTGVGLWTEDAINTVVSNSSLALDATRIPRVSQLVTLAFSLTSKIDYPYVLRLKWALETGARGSAVYSGNARLSFAVAYVPAGF